jgi:Bifunctional DNA primase/polymerase, N-terminal/AAA domain
MVATYHVQSPEIVERRITLALRMLELGAWVFPLAPGAKEPFVKKAAGGEGFKDARPEPEMARTFLSNAGQLNYGVTFPQGSDIFVLDIDGGERDLHPKWVEEWQALYDRYGPPGLTYIVRTPSGGRHAYYRWRGDLHGSMPAGDEMLGWTVRKPWKGYVVGPGSVVRGQVYEPAGLDAIADFPESWARAAIAEKATRHEDAIRIEAHGPDQVVVGHRHAYLRDQARHLVGIGLTGEALFAAVMDLNRQLIEPKTPDEVRDAIGDVETKFQRDPIDPETGRPVVSAQRNGALGRKTSEPPQVLTDLPFYTAAAVSAMTPEVIDWAWRDYLANGTIVEIVGPPKAGKTTFVMGLIRAYVDGLPFLDRPTAGGPVVVLSEQGPTSLRAVLARTGLAGREDVHLLMHRDVRGRSWQDVIATSVARCEAVGARVLLVDTLPAFAGLAGEAENNSGDALAAMEPLLTAAANGLAVIVNRHRRKSSQQGGPAGDVADEGRGSGAFSGAVDVILSLRRKPGGGRPTVRELVSASRFDETPVALFVEFKEDGQYVAVGDDAAIEASEARDAALLAIDDGLSFSMGELEKATGKTRATLQRVLSDLERTRDLERTGQGRSGSPYRWQRVPEMSAQSAQVLSWADTEAGGFTSAQTPTPYGGEQSGGSGQKPNARPAGDIACGSFRNHQTFHRQTAAGWICTACEVEA